MSKGREANIRGSPLPFYFLSKISTTLFGFSFSGIFFLLISLFNSVNVSLICFSVSSFIF